MAARQIMTPTWAQEIITAFRGRVKGDEITIKECPYCHNMRWNFQISITKCVFFCWVCNEGGFVTKFLQQFGIAYDADSVKPQRKKQEDTGPVELPDNRKILFNNTKIALMAQKYLESRDVGVKTIAEWDMRIGLGTDKDKWGFDYFGWTLVPFYGLEGLEYFCAVNNSFSKRYNLPSIYKDRFIPKRRGADSVILVEGLFDATSAWKYTELDVFPLFGKFLGNRQKELLLKVNYEKIYVCLDEDAMKEAIELSDDLYRSGGNAYLVRLPHDSDPNELGEHINTHIGEAIKFGITTKSRLARERLCKV